MQEPTQLSLQSLQNWRDLASDHFLKLDCQAPDNFRARALIARFGSSLAAEMHVSASRVLRRRRDAENSQVAFFKLFWQLSGSSRIEQGNHSAKLESGMWSIYDTTREYSIESSDRSRFMVLLMPQTECYGWSTSVGALAGQPLDGRGTPSIVMASLAGMLRDGSTLDPASQATLQGSTVALIERALENQLTRTGLSAKVNNNSRLEQVKGYIQHNLANTHLTPETIAQAFAISRRSLYNLFLDQRTTPRAFIQQARLERACTLLAHPEWRERTVAQIALGCGYTDPAHFSRAFTARFGMPPSAWRHRH